MEDETNLNQVFNINETDELTKQEILNSALIEELREYKEENTKLKHEKEILNSKIEKLEEENKTLKSENAHEETMEIIENILHSNHEIKDEPLDYDDLAQKSCGKSSNEEELEQNKDEYRLKPKVIRPRLKPKKFKTEVVNSDKTVEKSAKKKTIKHFICKSCDKSYTMRPNLVRHVTQIHRGKIHICSVCDKKFVRSDFLRGHFEKQHK